ncbi:MAG: nitroreductase [Bacteroidaceae bacterium]|nr:nitroreductase [Bacteroidaceae bacterium]
MEALEALYSRRSIKGFTDQMPTLEEIERVTKAGMAAPTGMGLQSPYIVVVKNRELRDELSRMNGEVLGTSSDPFYNAPVIIVVLADRSRGTYLYDGSLVIGNMLNAAHAIGLGACWIHRAKEVFASERGKALLAEWGVVTGGEDVEGIGHVALGYAAVEPKLAKPRKEGYVRVI